MPSVDDTTRGAFRDASEPTEGDSLPPGDGGDRLGPLLGSLPPDVFREVLLPILDELSRACFALSAGACFRAVKDAGLSWKLNACFLAAYSGDLGQLRYAHEHGCPWNEWTCPAAARRGHLECLQYAHEHDCPWDEWTCYGAAGKGHLKYLRYTHEHGRPRDEKTCYYAAGKGHLECLRYAHEWVPWHVELPLCCCATAIWIACGTHMSMGAPGTSERALLLQAKAMLECLRYA